MVSLQQPRQQAREGAGEALELRTPSIPPSPPSTVSWALPDCTRAIASVTQLLGLNGIVEARHPPLGSISEPLCPSLSQGPRARAPSCPASRPPRSLTPPFPRQALGQGRGWGQRGQAGSPRPPCHSPAQGFTPLSLLGPAGSPAAPQPCECLLPGPELGGGRRGDTRENSDRQLPLFPAPEPPP